MSIQSCTVNALAHGLALCCTAMYTWLAWPAVLGAAPPSPYLACRGQKGLLQQRPQQRKAQSLAKRLRWQDVQKTEGGGATGAGTAGQGGRAQREARFALSRI